MCCVGNGAHSCYHIYVLPRNGDIVQLTRSTLESIKCTIVMCVMPGEVTVDEKCEGNSSKLEESEGEENLQRWF
jgi:hypothetical protein